VSLPSAHPPSLSTSGHPPGLSTAGHPGEGLLLLEDGSLFRGEALSSGTRFGEVVFNTSMTGYQEILTDPSYRGQIVVMTQPHIGNYGTREAAAESARPWAEGFVARCFTGPPSGLAPEEGLPEYLRRWRVPAIHGIDTRAVVRRLRSHGALRGVVTTERSDVDALAAELADVPPMEGRALVDEVTCQAPWEMAAAAEAAGGGDPLHLAVYDFGAKRNILRSLAAAGCRVTVVPATTSAADILGHEPDGIFLSNGPADPAATGEYAIPVLRELIASGKPIFGICLGHQLLGLTLGGRSRKMLFGHRGANHPVKDLATGRVEVTSQNHGFEIDAASLPAGVTPSHLSLFDGSLEGLMVEGKPIFSVQYHPEASPGPQDASHLFQRFVKLMDAHG
jgi:carbamoyl-phosphate synthase small subunit